MKSRYAIGGASALLTYNEDGSWDIARIRVVTEQRGKGEGSAVLKMITSDADREGVTLFLGVDPSGPLDFLALVAWYERNGFILRDRNPGHSKAYMIRYPR